MVRRHLPGRWRRGRSSVGCGRVGVLLVVGVVDSGALGCGGRVVVRCVLAIVLVVTAIVVVSLPVVSIVGGGGTYIAKGDCFGLTPTAVTAIASPT
eukprot:2705158-Rhodomonas_salina.1